ncbi:MAG: hypothetical protein LBE13_09105 [Bacteroidales bacterium]|jgi:hypothetical protein|nr:hypothetical protein [Bacteroidales bacterium]
MRLRKRYKLLIASICVSTPILVTAYFISVILLVCLLVLNGLLILFVLSATVLSKLVMMTNWYKNNFIYTKQFVTSLNFRKNTQRNYEIVNVGSNSARFAFFYEDIIGQNWSTGEQGLDKDMEILRYFYSLVKKDGIVLLPVCAFSSVAGCLQRQLPYTAKFAAILDRRQINTMQRGRKSYIWMKYPLDWKSLCRLFIHDVQPDNRLSISEQMMQPLELNTDALKWMDGWKKDFNIKDFNAPLSPELQEGRKISIKNLQNMIDFCIERNLKPVLIIPPMTKYLSCLFTETIRETYIYSFIREANVKNIPFLDYMDDERFSNPSLYFNSFFLNLRGRKLFTKQVLKDLNITK